MALISSKDLKRLYKSKKERDEAGIFFIEGKRICFELLKNNNIEPIQIIISESFSKDNSEDLKSFQGIGDLMVLKDSVFDNIADTKSPQGIIAVIKQIDYNNNPVFLPCFEETSKIDYSYVIIERLQDPGNLGTIMRSALASGISGVIIDKESVSIYNPKATRATMGAILRLPFIIVDNLKEIIIQMQKNGINCYSAQLESKNPYYSCDFTVPTAFLLGNEGNGLSMELISITEKSLIIPMENNVESLNVGIAGTILMYELYRQRTI